MLKKLLMKPETNDNTKKEKSMENEEDFEEGEILDSEEDETNEENGKTRKSDDDEKDSDKEPEPDPIDTYNVISRPSNENMYRQQRKPIQDSESDDNSALSSDEDTDLWKLKKSKFFLKNTDSSDMQISDVIKSPVKANTGESKECPMDSARSINFQGQTQTKPKKKNNIWGSVLTEQSLTQTMGSIGVERKLHVVNNYRTVEAYDFLQARNDDRPFEKGTDENPDSIDPFRKVIGSHDKKHEKGGYKRHKRQHSGERHHGGKRQKRYRTCNEEDTDQVIIDTIVENLHEEKSYLIEKILGVIGKKKAIELMYATEDVEESGGMKTFDGKRRRTPGGVYIQLIKQDKDITKEMVDEMFFEEQNNYKKEQRKQKKQRRKEMIKLRKMLPQNRYQNDTRKNPNDKKDQSVEGEGQTMETMDNAMKDKDDEDDDEDDDDILNQEDDIILDG